MVKDVEVDLDSLVELSFRNSLAALIDFGGDPPREDAVEDFLLDATEDVDVFLVDAVEDFLDWA